MANNLKPCHVCGADRGLYILEDYEGLEWYVFCDNCKTSVHNENAQTKEEAIEIWNKRYERTCHLISSEWGTPLQNSIQTITVLNVDILLM